MVAEIEPVPETPKDAPVPTTIAAVVFVLLVSAEKADEPPLPPAVNCDHEDPLYWQVTTVELPPVEQSLELVPSVTTAIVPLVFPLTEESPETVVMLTPLPPEAAPCPGVSVCACASSDANRSAMTQLKFRLTAASAIH